MASSASAAREYDNFFQTTDTLAATGRRAAKAGNKHGRPVSVGAKLSAIALDPASSGSGSGSDGRASRVYVAGADGCVRRVKVPGAATVGGREKAEKGGVDLTLAGPRAPLTCLEVVVVRAANSEEEAEVEVFAGCWDKCVYVWRVRDGKQVGEPRAFRNGHDDFVKCLAVYQTQLPPVASNSAFLPTPQTLTILISGSADRSLVIWDATTGKRLSRQPGFHKTSLYALAVSSLSPPDIPTPITSSSDTATTITRFLLYSGSSDGEIRETEFLVQDAAPNLTISQTGNGIQLREIHPTSVYALKVCSNNLLAPEDSDSDDQPDSQIVLASASADGTAALSRRHGIPSPADDAKDTDSSETTWSVASRVTHGSHVRCLAVGHGGKLYTGGRDEDVKLWDADANANGDLCCVFDGHFDEVTGLVADGVGVTERAVSCSLDGTVRVWDGEEVERGVRRMELEEGEDGGGEGGEVVAAGQESEEAGAEGSKPQLTAEEEAELAELMEDSD